ncbi:MAG: insulinase family protein [Candidatus Gastranaerophilales bacterium]|nr:insulinase family protein [Candidatus Gastranaerophilales bacterium]
MKKLAIIISILFLNLSFCLGLEEGLSVTTLPSGQKVIIKEIHDNAIVKIDTWINTGSINEDDKTNGISHFLEHLFFKGTQKYPTGTFDKILDSKGAHVNAATSKDYTHYYIEIPSEYFDLALNLHADMLQNPMIPRKELEKERSVVIEEISKTKDSPSNRVFDNIYKIFYEKSNHPYKRTVIGTKENIQTVTREEILDYFNRFYTPDAYTTVIVGDVNKLDALKKTAAAFNREKRNKENIKYPQIKPLNGIERIYDTMDINKNHTIIAFLAPKFKDEKDNYPLDVLSTMLSDGKSSILNQSLKEDKELVLSVSAGNYSQKDSGIFYIYTTYNPDNEEKIESAVTDELKKIQAGDFDENLIAKAKNQIKTDTYYSRESISNISDELGYIYTFSGNLNYYENYLKNIDKVTKEDIIKAAKKYLTLDKYALSTIRARDFKPVSNTIKKDETKPKLIQQLNDTKKVMLENNAILITKKKKTNSIIAMDISIKGSKALEEKPITAMLAASASTTGSSNYTNSQFAQFLDENGIRLGVSSSNDVFSIVIQTTKDNLDKAFVALNEVINNPTFQDSEINKIKQRKIQELKAISDSPSSYVFDEFKRLAFQNSIYGQNSTFILNNINNVTRNDIVEFYSKIINPENMNITVVGDIDENYISSQLNKIIKKNDKSQKFEYSKQYFSSFKPKKNIETTLYKNEVQANWMALGYKTCGALNRRDIAILNVINAILGEGMSSRLFVNLRENKALGYTVGSTLSTNVLDGAFVAYIGTNKNSIEEAKQGLIDEIERLKSEPVTSAELQNAKDKITGKFLLGLETNMSEADLLSWYSVLGRDLGAFEEYKKAIKNVSQNDILEIANKYFSQPYIYTVVMEK